MQRALSEPGRRTQILGRASECALLDDLVSAIRRGQGRPLVVRGEAGVGKTALLEYLVESTADLSVFRATGVESEMELAYAGLQQLCAPMLDRRSRLVAAHRQALEVVFGLTSGPAPDRFLVGVAVLSLLSEMADERGLLCVLDDAQWLDDASALTLAFVARRLRAEPIGIVFSTREPTQELRNLPELEITGLANRHARALLDSAVLFKLDPQVRDRMIAETRGNPLALIELPKGLTVTQLAGGFGLLDAGGLPEGIEESFLRRVGGLSEPARRLLLLAAAEPVGDPLLLSRAAKNLGIREDSAKATDGLLSIGLRVTFRHPLVRSAVYRAASPEQRRAVHRALAEAIDEETDPDRRAWHRAAAAVGPDEQVAAELERSAERAQARGGRAAAAAFLERSVSLSADPAPRTARALAAAQASLQAGAFDAALRLSEAAEEGPLDGFQRARVTLLRGQMAFVSGFGGDAPPLLLKAATELEPYDLELAHQTYLNAWGAAASAGGRLLPEICAAALALPPSPRTPHPVGLLLEGLALLTTEGRTAATPTLQHAAEALADLPGEDVLRLGALAQVPSSLVWDLVRYREISARLVHLARDAGAFFELPIHLFACVFASTWMGDLAGAESLVAEMKGVSEVTGSPISPVAVMMLRAVQGREAEVCEALASMLELAAPGQQEGTICPGYFTVAVLYNGLARYEEAASAAQRSASYTLHPWAMWPLPELVEAAVRTGDLQLGRDAFERLVDATQPCSADWAAGIEARSRALLADDAPAEASYREAIRRLGRDPIPTELARAHLLYGEWLRSAGRRAEAREQLRTAHQMFVTIGMEAFADRARKELMAAGEQAHKRTVETRDDLTPQERQIAELARDGLSNPEIGARLFLSPRTVEWHLRKVFGKLGIRSRHELAEALARSEVVKT
jgi:DNA-binding CsgD family transcriptional regulator